MSRFEYRLLEAKVDVEAERALQCIYKGGGRHLRAQQNALYAQVQSMYKGGRGQKNDRGLSKGLELGASEHVEPVHTKRQKRSRMSPENPYKRSIAKTQGGPPKTLSVAGILLLLSNE